MPVWSRDSLRILDAFYRAEPIQAPGVAQASAGALAARSGPTGSSVAFAFAPGDLHHRGHGSLGYHRERQSRLTDFADAMPARAVVSGFGQASPCDQETSSFGSRATKPYAMALTGRCGAGGCA